jgi:hypothetical protein
LRQLNYWRILNKNAEKIHKNISAAKYIQNIGAFKNLGGFKNNGVYKIFGGCQNLGASKIFGGCQNLGAWKNIGVYRNVGAQEKLGARQCWRSRKSRRVR